MTGVQTCALPICKRPKMGRIAARLADFVIVTSDNPRTEVPGDIIREILPGLEGSTTPWAVVEDRVEAIRYALDHAQPEDVIILACDRGRAGPYRAGWNRLSMPPLSPDGKIAGYYEQMSRAVPSRIDAHRDRTTPTVRPLPAAR